MSTIYFSLPGYIDSDGDYTGEVIRLYETLITEKHEALFNFLDFDFEMLKNLLLSYFDDFDTNSLAFNTKSKDKKLQIIQECFKTLHPIYNVYGVSCSEINNGIRIQFNDLLSKAGYINKKAVPKEKYFLLLKDLSLGNYFDIGEEYRDEHYEEYLKYNIFDNDYDSIFHSLLETRDTINKMLFWILDYSIPKLTTALSINQRATLYSDIFVGELSEFLTLTKEYKFLSRKHLPAELDFLSPTKDEDTQAGFYSQVYNLHNINGEIVFPNALDLIISAIQNDKEDSLSETYEINNISQLLLMEIMDMISDKMAIKKCRYCNRYFLVENLKNEYCNRIAVHETKPCSVIGSTRTYQNKSKTDIPLMLHQKGYKTHYARIKNSKGKLKMSQNEFQIWAIEAKQKLDAVRAGELACDEFEKWLKR